MRELILTILTSGLLLTGCSTTIENPNQRVNNNNFNQEKLTEGKIKKFQNLEELKQFLKNNQAGDKILYDGKMRTMEMGEAMPMMTKNAESESLDGSNKSDDYSRTNVQIEGVDEADIIKTDGEYIYAVSENDLFIIKANPAENAEILSKIEFESRPQDIYINGDYLAIFGYDNQIHKMEEYSRFKRQNTYTFFKIFNINDRKNPKQIRDLDFEGNYSNSRMIGDYVYFTTNNYHYNYFDKEPILPRILEDGQTISSKCGTSDKCILPEIYYFDIPYDSYNFTNISAINIKNPEQEIKTETYLMSGNQNMYVSQNNIYITYTKYISEYEIEMEVMQEIILPKLNQEDQDKIKKIQNTENYILSKYEKRNKIAQILENYGSSLNDQEQKNLEQEIKNKIKEKYENLADELEKTIIHKITINKGDLEYKTFGQVVGKVLNQFSMDEEGEYFRIATTRSRHWSRFDEEETKSYNNLYILDKDLKQVGALEGLAKDERIYSVRFMQNRAYMVTFKQTDPLFVIDLENPKNPKVLGELKIPGFSNYLHPYNENLLIGLGQDTAENEWGGVENKGVKLSLFNVADVKNPQEVDTYILGDKGSNSIAQHDHKAFLFSKDKNLLVIPVAIREATDSRAWGSVSFRGAAVFNVNENGFDLRGKISHSDGNNDQEDNWGGYNYYNTTVKRSLYIDNILYTFSNDFLKINDLDNLNEIKNLELRMEEDYKIVN